MPLEISWAKPDTTKMQCPRCRSRSFTATITVATDIVHDIVNGEIRVIGPESITWPTAAYGRCRCGHRWTIRDANRVHHGD